MASSGRAKSQGKAEGVRTGLGYHPSGRLLYGLRRGWNGDPQDGSPGLDRNAEVASGRLRYYYGGPHGSHDDTPSGYYALGTHTNLAQDPKKLCATLCKSLILAAHTMHKTLYVAFGGEGFLGTPPPTRDMYQSRWSRFNNLRSSDGYAIKMVYGFVECLISGTLTCSECVPPYGIKTISPTCA